MVTGGVELIVGVRRDHSFGPVLLVGAGGVLAELVKDVAVALAPVSDEEAARLLGSLKIGRVLRELNINTQDAARAAAHLSRFAAAHPELSEVEVNPLVATRGGAIALDARLARA
jgi:succinyl-CoA synthetase beta subunit